LSKIRVRHSAETDMQSIADIYSGSSAIAGTLQLPHPSVAIWSERFAKSESGVYSLVACYMNEASDIDADTNEDKCELVVGHLALRAYPNPRRKHVGYIGMAVHDNHVGEGIGSALLEAALDMADNWLNLTRVELTVFVDNEAAVALYKKFNFVVEGEAARYAFRNGDYHNVYYMARVS